MESTPMKSVIVLLALALSACAASPSTVAQDMYTSQKDNRISLYLGQRDLDKSDYDPVDRQGTVGIEYVRETADSVVGFEIGAMASEDKDNIGAFDVKGTTREAYLGIHKSIGTDVVRPYVGAGVAVIESKVDVSGGGSDSDSSPAGYVHGGLTFDFTSSFFVGLDLRFLFASDMTIAGVNTDADYGQLALTFGFAF
jgi:hypothetical protein